MLSFGLRMIVDWALSMSRLPPIQARAFRAVLKAGSHVGVKGWATAAPAHEKTSKNRIKIARAFTITGPGPQKIQSLYKFITGLEGLARAPLRAPLKHSLIVTAAHFL